MDEPRRIDVVDPDHAAIDGGELGPRRVADDH